MAGAAVPPSLDLEQGIINAPGVWLTDLVTMVESLRVAYGQSTGSNPRGTTSRGWGGRFARLVRRRAARQQPAFSLAMMPLRNGSTRQWPMTRLSPSN